MTKVELTGLLGGWEGYVVSEISRFAADLEQGDTQPRIEIELKPDQGHRHVCSGCGQVVEAIHDMTKRWVRDLPILDAETYLLVPRYRVNCPDCGPKVETVPWLDKYARVTKRLAESVARMCQVLPIKHVAEYFDLHWDTVKEIDQSYLEWTVGPPDLQGISVFIMDEFAIQKGHRYATVFVDPYTRRVLWVCRGRTQEDIRPFFDALGVAGKLRIRAVGMDMSPSFEAEVRYQCPFAEIVYDLFHVVAKYGRDVVDKVRVAEAQRAANDQRQRDVIKGARWLLLRNKENLSQPRQRVQLRELLAANHRLCTVYVLKDDLKELWKYCSPTAATKFWKDWYNRAIRSQIEPLKKFARNLKEKLSGVLAHCRWPIHTSLLEGINNKIKVIKRMAYGFRDDNYFFLKIRAAFH